MPVEFIHRRTLFATLRTLWSRVILFKMDLKKDDNAISTNRIQLLDSCSTGPSIGREYKWSARIGADYRRHDWVSPSKQQWLMGVEKVSLLGRSVFAIGILGSRWVVSYRRKAFLGNEKKQGRLTVHWHEHKIDNIGGCRSRTEADCARWMSTPDK